MAKVVAGLEQLPITTLTEIDPEAEPTTTEIVLDVDVPVHPFGKVQV
jgi:hypothetical protein